MAFARTHADSKRTRPFGLRDKLGYMCGDFGNDFSFLLQSLFFLVFYTDIMGIKAAHVGTLFLVARLIDAFTDVGMGRLIDVLKPGARGRFRPWILRMCIPVSVASLLMYMPFVAHSAYGVRVAYMCITYLFWGSIFYTSINIPYGSMAAVVSDKPEHRASLSVFRSLGGQSAMLIIASVLPLIVYDNDNNILAGRMVIAAIGCAICGIICYLLCYANVEERIRSVVEKKERTSFAAMLGTLVHNRPLLMLVAGAICFLIGNQMVAAVTSYLWKNYFERGSMQSPAQIVAAAPVFLLSLITTYLSMKYGKKELLVLLLGFSSVMSIVTYFMHLDASQIPLFMVMFFFVNLGVGFYNVVVWAMITDVLDYQEVMTGARDDGVVYAIYSWSRKLGQALAGWLAGQALTWVGYDSVIAREGGTQSPATLEGIYMLFLLVPGILYLCCTLIMAFGYPLTKNRVNAHYELLKARHAEKAGR